MLYELVILHGSKARCRHNWVVENSNFKNWSFTHLGQQWTHLIIKSEDYHKLD